jgi:hypothetical protein
MFHKVFDRNRERESPDPRGPGMISKSDAE